MKPKKSQKADLESKRTIFIQIGMIVALSLVFFAFEIKSYDKIEIEWDMREGVDMVEEIIIQTEQNLKPPLPKPPPQITMLNIVDDDDEPDYEIIVDAEAGEETKIDDYFPVDIEDEKIDENEIFPNPEQQPSFPGGDAARMKFLQQNIKYPQWARESGIQGPVYITFVVEPDGSISSVEILRGIGGGCDEEAIRVIESMPKWNPGKQWGRAVRVQFNMPIKFTLRR